MPASAPPAAGRSTLELVFDDARFPAVWLRDNCPCPLCAIPGSGQKLFGITDLPGDPRIASVAEDDASVTVSFAPDGHVSRFPRSWLRRHRPDRDIWPGPGLQVLPEPGLDLAQAPRILPQRLLQLGLLRDENFAKRFV